MRGMETILRKRVRLTWLEISEIKKLLLEELEESGSSCRPWFEKGWPVITAIAHLDPLAGLKLLNMA